ncbi:MAG: hypothetical protein U5L09_01110 [Bacteroidales bacterium]|nr:hypothetical protein [Bacteroidales bacterium]
MKFKTLLYSLLKLLLSMVQLAFLVAVVFFLYTIYQDFAPKQVTSLTVKAPQKASAAAQGTHFFVYYLEHWLWRPGSRNGFLL